MPLTCGAGIIIGIQKEYIPADRHIEPDVTRPARSARTLLMNHPQAIPAPGKQIQLITRPIDRPVVDRHHLYPFPPDRLLHHRRQAGTQIRHGVVHRYDDADRRFCRVIHGSPANEMLRPAMHPRRTAGSSAQVTLPQRARRAVRGRRLGPGFFRGCHQRGMSGPGRQCLIATSGCVQLRYVSAGPLPLLPMQT